MDFVVDEVTAPDGAVLVRNYLQHPSAVGVIAVDDQERVAIVRQYRHPVRRRCIEAPAGLCDQVGEDPLEAAKRELAEECGLAANDWRMLVDIYATPGSSTQSTRIFLARGLRAVAAPEGFSPEGEEAEMIVAWAGVDDLLEAIFSGNIMNPTLVSGLLAYKYTQLS
jgi:ADP-ribose pyrophosphatase